MEHADPPASEPLDAREIARQAEVEIAVLLALESAMRTALQWMTRGRGNSRKLSTLRFQLWSFERHLTRTQILADHGGYMHVVIEAAPHLVGEVHALENERAGLHANLDRLIVRMENISQDDAPGFASICADLERLLDQLRAQGEREREPVHHVLTKEGAGPA
jgi:hypothetical protein